MPTLIAVLNHRILVARHAQRWHLSSPLEGHRFTCAAADPHRPGRAYLGTHGAGLWRTDDDGAAWTQPGPAPGSAPTTV